MTVVVDECRWDWRGRRWCHLASDHSLDELHAFAAHLGLPAHIFQGDHYDLHEDLRAMALDAGARPVTSRQLLAGLRRAGLRLSPAQRRGRAPLTPTGPVLGLDASTRAVYERGVDAYAHSRPVVHTDRALAFATRCLPDRPVVDLGCGPGGYLPALGAALATGQALVGLDLATAMLQRARVVGVGAAFVQAELEALPFAPGVLGGAWSRNGHVHIPRRRLPWALAQLQRAMAVGAPLSLSLVAGDREGLLDGDDLPGRWFAGWTAEQLHDVVVGAGFEIDSLRTVETSSGSESLVVSATRARTLPDLVSGTMRMLVCGLNPSIVAADAGVGFVGATNRFWPAAIAAGLVDVPRDPARALLERGIGMTDLVKRATPRSSDVRRQEYVDGHARLTRLVDWLRPGVVCVVGLEGWRAAVDRRTAPGWQEAVIGTRPVYVLPSTSGLNARTSLAELVAHLRRAAAGPNG